MTIDEIKILLRITTTDEDEMLNLLLDNAIASVLLYIGESTVAQEIEYIINELVIIRYNKLGAEGINAENLQGNNYTFGLDDLKHYKKELDYYKSGGNKLRMM